MNYRQIGSGLIFSLIFAIGISRSALASMKAKISTEADIHIAYRINITSASPFQIVKLIKEKYGVVMVGFESLSGQEIQFSAQSDSLEQLLQQIIRQFGGNSYAFEYHGDTLAKVYLIPEESDAVSFHTEQKMADKPRSKILAAKVSGFAGQPNDEASELQKDDIIIAFDETRITGGPLQVTQLMKNKPDYETTELTVIRENIPIHLFIGGGLFNTLLTTVELNDNQPYSNDIQQEIAIPKETPAASLYKPFKSMRSG